MKLRDDEKRMLDGEEGHTIQKAMELLVKIGDAHGAEDMLDISYAHIESGELERVLYNLVSDFTKGVRVRVPTGTMPLVPNPYYLEAMKIPAQVVEDIKKPTARILDLHNQLGAMCTYSCFPFFVYPLRLGEHMAWTETQVTPFANSWFGARTNLQACISAVASAVTGKTPNYGLHLTENRLGTGLIEVDPKLKPENFDYADYAALSYWAGVIMVNYEPVIPVYNGLSPKATTYSKVKGMCAPNVWNSGMPMFHVVGVTPEAYTIEAAFGGRKPSVTVQFGKKEMVSAYEELSTATDRKVDVVTIGCPHCSIKELEDIARLLNGRKVHKDTQLWVGTNEAFKSVAERMGIIKAIEEAGGLVITSGCPCPAPLALLQPRVVATTSGLASPIIRIFTKDKVAVWFGKLSDCINAAIKGKWEAS